MNQTNKNDSGIEGEFLNSTILERSIIHNLIFQLGICNINIIFILFFKNKWKRFKKKLGKRKFDKIESGDNEIINIQKLLRKWITEE